MLQKNKNNIANFNILVLLIMAISGFKRNILCLKFQVFPLF